MTLAQSSESAHQSSGSARVTPQSINHNAHDEASNMSNPGPEVPPSMTSSAGTIQPTEPTEPAERRANDASTQTLEQIGSSVDVGREAHLPIAATSSKIKVSNRVRIVDLVQQLRHEKYLENRVNVLQQRKRILRRTISLSARLHRLQFMIREGLTEIADKRDSAIPFKKVLQFTQELVHRCYSRWNAELHALDPLETSDPVPVDIETGAHVEPRLSSSSRFDILLLLNRFRNNSTYILRHIKALPGDRLQGLSRTPRFEQSKPDVPGFLPNRTRKPQQQRLQNLAKNLQEYAFALERSNPWSFLLFNIYGTESSPQGPEHLLRMSTWSTVLADLYVNYAAGFETLAPLLFNSFALVQDWHARERVELLLMDILQQGAFLLGSADQDLNLHRNFGDPSQTPEAQSLFSHAALEMLSLFSKCDGGFPPATMQFMSAVLGKLPTEELQSGFRGYCFGTWFIGDFLRQAVTYPETEHMLLNFHVSQAARERILMPLWNRINDAIHEVHQPDPVQPVEPALIENVINIVYAMKASVVTASYPRSSTDSLEISDHPTVFVCVSEIIRLLDALSPQVQQGAPHDSKFVESSRQFFQASHAQYPLNRLREELLNLQGSASSDAEIHPCDEQWMEFRIRPDGQLENISTADHVQTSSLDLTGPGIDSVQAASLKLCSSSIMTLPSFEGSTNYRTDVLSDKPLTTLFQGIIRSPKARIDSVYRMYWEAALRSLTEMYPICDLLEDDSAILRPLVLRSKSLQSQHVENCARLEAEVSLLEDTSSKIKYATMTMVEQSDDLKVKLWYSTNVATSKSYADAKNVSEALTNMALLTMVNTTPAGLVSQSRPSSSRSAASSIFQQPVSATLGMLKARAEHGGPKKLSDEQITLTDSWLREADIENFCRGEERIHRFCMEVSSTSKAIISESSERSASPVLWYNVLFSNDEVYHNLYTPGVSSAPASTRPASVSSEPYAMSIRSSRPAYRSGQTTRSIVREERLSPTRRQSGHGSWSNRLDRDFQQTDSIFQVGSPGRAYSSTTAESISTFWSPQPSNPRSLTSVSAYSRPPSMYNEGSNNRFHDQWQEKSETLDALRHKLVCLLLSDLGCAVWSRGCETDAWLQSIRDDEDVMRELEQQAAMKQSARVDVDVSGLEHARRPLLQRRESNPTSTSIQDLTSDPTIAPNTDLAIHHGDNSFMALEELLIKMRSQVDPKKKLQAVEDFHNISVDQVREAHKQRQNRIAAWGRPMPQRRNSTGAPSLEAHFPNMQRQLDGAYNNEEPTDAQIIHQLKSNIMALRPPTLFRDLQYIAALLPHELSSRTTRGGVVIRMGLAALAYKDDLCSSMVAVADKLISKDAVKRPILVDPPDTTIKRAAEFWMIAAREGNAVAQRELGMLYLSHPQAIPILTHPLHMASKVFQHETQWPEQYTSATRQSSLSLALHWMRLAADNGDPVAQKKLAERQAGISLR